MRALPALLAACLASCHLGGTEDPPTCAPGSHPERGYCVADPPSGPVITIAAATAGAPCTVSPDSVTVGPQREFNFNNNDTVDHVIAGADGKEWVTAMAGQPSAYIGITRVGTFPYTVSGCAKGGTVVVE